MIYGHCDLAAIQARINSYNYVAWGAIALTFLASSAAREVVALALAGQQEMAVAKAEQVRCIAAVKIVIGVVLAVAIDPCAGVDLRTCHCKFSKIYPMLCIGIGLSWLVRGGKLRALAAAAGQLPTATTAQLPAPGIPIAHAQVVPALATPYDEAPLVCSK